ncbi:hypothetical protein V8F20_005739 [Naviculisporaceae sp. PSN 640]
MKSVFVALAAFAAAAIAAESECAADYIVEACLGSETAKLATCGDNDWDCKCYAHQNILTCFNNCPNDSRVHQWEGQKQIFCSYATQFPSSTTKVAPATTGANSPAKTTAGKEEDGATNTDKTDATGTATGTAAAATKTDSGAADLAYNAGSMLAAVAAVAAAVL